MTHAITDQYTIQQVAEMTHISAHTLRFYEKIGLIQPVYRLENGHRRYSEEDLGWIHFIILLRETGMPIPQMQEFLDLARNGSETIPDRITLLSAHREALFARISELQDYLDHLDRKIDAYSRMLEKTTADISPTR